jgi:hypothetical protein
LLNAVGDFCEFLAGLLMIFCECFEGFCGVSSFLCDDDNDSDYCYITLDDC